MAENGHVSLLAALSRSTRRPRKRALTESSQAEWDHEFPVTPQRSADPWTMPPSSVHEELSQSMPQQEQSTPPTPPLLSNNIPLSSSRYDNSLGLLTRRFVSLLREAPDGVLNLNMAATRLDVAKRRIYDITNVLEGIGVIEKTGKNSVIWRGFGFLTQQGQSAAEAQESVESREWMRHHVADLKMHVFQLAAQEQRLDELTLRVQGQLRSMAEDERHRSLAYLTHADMRTVPGLSDETLFAVKAPYGSTLEVPDPEDPQQRHEERRFEIQLMSQNGPIDVFLIEDPEQGSSKLVEEEKNIQKATMQAANETVHAVMSGVHCFQDITPPNELAASPLLRRTQSARREESLVSGVDAVTAPSAYDPEGLLKQLDFPGSDPYAFDLLGAEGPSPLLLYEQHSQQTSAPTIAAMGSIQQHPQHPSLQPQHLYTTQNDLFLHPSTPAAPTGSSWHPGPY